MLSTLRLHRQATGTRHRRRCFLAAGVLVVASLVPVTSLAAQPAAAVAPLGSGFTLNAGDLRFILEQIKIAEAHAAAFTPGNFTSPKCSLVRGTGAHQVPNPLLPYGLRTVDGSCNNLQPGQGDFGAAQRPMPRLAPPVFRDAESSDVPGMGPVGPPGRTSYRQTSGTVVDSRPRMVSNLIADQTADNPAAVQAAARPRRAFDPQPSAVPCTSPGVPAGCTPDGQTLFIPNVTTDAGLSPPFNSWFTLFGQFFDHGLDFTVKGGSGSVIVPLKPGDPLYDPNSNTNFMVLTRARNLPGPDGVRGTADDVHEATNTDSPWVDQNQTYASHPSHQVFLRAYTRDAAGHPVSTGKLIEGARGGMASWAELKAHAADLLGIRLEDADVSAVPLLATDPYGRFLPGPNGFPLMATTTGFVEGDPTANGGTGVLVPSDAERAGVAFLDDIAHNAAPAAGLVPDADNVASTDFAAQPQGTYDDELLDAHFVAGDGRVNENIGLTAVHQIFHSEHNRLVDDIENLITTQNVDVAQWQLSPGVWNGERIFQAARFVTEMEYQHLVFEEFARKVQPALDPFSAVQSDIDPAINAEFAHAVYRFGHSMLTDTIARTNADGSSNDIPLLDGFLNPLAYTDGGQAGRLTPQQAAGSIVMGMTEQTGNEIDEFVTETLRNDLLGLPLDLATINLTRGRDAGVPPLNEFRRQVYAATRDAALRPYSSWTDYGLALKHPDSLVNFLAAYGTHPSITGATTLAQKRAAARLIYEDDAVHNPGTPANADAFLNGTGAWAGRPTGLEDVDLWIGGLAESTRMFGGLLGSTFGYVFEQQLAKLQSGDRFYYLARLAGLNLLTEIEGSSFAEMVMRNTDAQSLKADVFATPDCEFELANLGTSGPVADDPASQCDESKVLVRMPDGTIRYRPSNSVDPPGINPQSTYNGTAAGDRVWGGLDDDTFWGNQGNDQVEGDEGSDSVLGGVGNDVITDSNGDDVLKGGPDDDAIDGGPGLDEVMGGYGSDFVLGGPNTDTIFAGEGNDLVEAGPGLDLLFGDGGDDWVEGSSGSDELQGDNGSPIPTDLNTPGDDVLISQGGDDAIEAEGGDDTVVVAPGIEDIAGLHGFDWVTHVGDPQAADADLNRALSPLPPPPTSVFDRYAEVEGLSGWRFDDVLRGDDPVPAPTDVLTAAGMDRVAGLRQLLPAGTTSFGAGNIILGGSGSDTIQGRGGDDVIDGDAWLNVRLSVRTNPADPRTEIRSADSMAELRADVLAGTLDPADVVIVREIRGNPAPGDVDTAVFSDVRANYDVSTVGGVTTVTHTVAPAPGGGGGGEGGGAVSDGTDTLTGIEQLEFADAVIPVGLSIGIATAGNTSATVTWSVNGADTTGGFQVRVVNAGGGQVGPLRTAPPDARSLVVDGLANGFTYRLQVRAVGAAGQAFTDLSNPVTPAGAPARPRVTGVTPHSASARVHWSAPVSDGGSALSTYDLRVVDRTGTQVGALRSVPASVRSVLVRGLANGQAYRFQVRAVNGAGAGPFSALSAPVVPARAPSAPVIGSAEAGSPAGVLTTATAHWSPPPSDGGSAVRGYVVTALHMASAAPSARVLSRTQSPLLAAGARSRTFVLRPGVYRFQVVARNAVGASPASERSNAVRPR